MGWPVLKRPGDPINLSKVRAAKDKCVAHAETRRCVGLTRASLTEQTCRPSARKRPR
jgi:hypothetical protein